MEEIPGTGSVPYPSPGGVAGATGLRRRFKTNEKEVRRGG
jgi:hypothetical protein